MKRFEIVCITFLIIFNLNETFAISEDSINVPRSSMAFNLMPFANFRGITYEGLIAQRFNIEAGVGLIGVGGGLSYYLQKPKFKKISPYLGFKSYLTTMIHARTQVVSYVPLGATFLNEYLFLSLDFGPAIYDIKSGSQRDERNGINVAGKKEFGLIGSVKVGLRFQIWGRKKIKKPWYDLFI
jgi:hypothetical protein